MGSYSEEVRAMVRAELGPELMRDLLALTEDIYATAARRTRDLSRPGRDKLFPSLRLVLLEEGLSALAKRHPGVTAVERKTKKGTYQFVMLQKGAVVVAPSSVRSRYALPRRAHFRDTLAAGEQYDCFEDTAATGDRKFWFALLLHAAGYKKLNVDGETVVVRSFDAPDFVDLAVPTRDASRVCTIDLRDASAPTVAPAEEDVPDTMPKRKAPAEKKQRDTDAGAA
jgi:hypothetical protein